MAKPRIKQQLWRVAIDELQTEAVEKATGRKRGVAERITRGVAKLHPATAAANAYVDAAEVTATADVKRMGEAAAKAPPGSKNYARAMASTVISASEADRIARITTPSDPKPQTDCAAVKPPRSTKRVACDTRDRRRLPNYHPTITPRTKRSLSTGRRDVIKRSDATTHNRSTGYVTFRRSKL